MSIVEFIANNLFISEDEIRSYLRTVPRRYKKFTINKRNGDKRLIAQPAKQVKILQRSVISEIRNSIPIHECAYAYQKNKNIKSNAQCHVGNCYLLKMDFKNFFLSIKPPHFISLFALHGIDLSEDDQLSISNLFFWKLRRTSPLRLSIGAPSSPFISNAVMYFFDAAIYKECQKLGVNYTRYADDLTFSTSERNILVNIPDLVKKELKDNGLHSIKINKNKTVFSSRKFNRHVTGVTLNNAGAISLGREKKRLLSAKIHHFSLGILNTNQILELKGLLGFAKYIEPAFIERMRVKYGPELITEIQKYAG